MLGGTVRTPPGRGYGARGRGHRDEARQVTCPTVEMDEGPEDESPSFRAPLPPSDRLWRHPSEMGGGADPGSQVALQGGGARRPWVVALVGGGLGVCVAIGVMAIFGMLDHKVVERLVIEREAVAPAAATVSTPSASVAGVVKNAAPAIARLEVLGAIGAASGSGVLFRDDGYLITNAHVVSDATAINVILADGSQHEGSLIGSDPDSDIAVVKIGGSGHPTRVLGQAATLQVGQTAIAIGSPLGLEGGPSVTLGVISALNRTVDTHGGDAALTGMIQTDASIPWGRPGRPLRHKRRPRRDHHRCRDHRVGHRGPRVCHPDRGRESRRRTAHHRRQGRAGVARRARRGHVHRASKTTAPKAERCCAKSSSVVRPPPPGSRAAT